MVSLQKMNSSYKAKLELADGSHNGEKVRKQRGGRGICILNSESWSVSAS